MTCRWACMLLVLLLLSPVLVHAQEPSAAATSQPTSYEVALSEALAAHARGDYAQARIFMERAHQLEPSARTLRGLGIVAFAQGRHLEAIRFLDQSLLSSDKPLSPELRLAVEELLGHAWGQVGRYNLVIDPETGDFLIDGREPDWYAAHTVVLSPGNHVLTARAPARVSYELTVSVKPGEQRALHIVLAVMPAAATVAPAQHVTATQPPGFSALPGTFWQRRGRWLAVFSGTALLATGGALWGVAYRRLDHIKERCEDHVDSTCTSAEASAAYDKQNVKGLAIGAGLTLGAGAAVLLGAGGVAIWQRKQRDKRPAVAVSAGLGSLLVRGTF